MAEGKIELNNNFNMGMKAEKLRYAEKEWAEHERRAEKIEKIVRTISGWATVVFMFLILGKAGASDCGAPLEEIFPSTFIYCGLMIVSFHIWEAAGGNRISK